MSPGQDGWDEWGKHVLLKLERLGDCYESLREEITQIKVDLAGLKIKAGLWGAAAASVPVIIGITIALAAVATAQ